MRNTLNHHQERLNYHQAKYIKLSLAKKQENEFIMVDYWINHHQKQMDILLNRIDKKYKKYKKQVKINLARLAKNRKKNHTLSGSKSK
tara:strand:- start:20686 stop:20949 length:264 start_codon:yes stop_codon:yes gene_type:complete